MVSTHKDAAALRAEFEKMAAEQAAEKSSAEDQKVQIDFSLQLIRARNEKKLTQAELGAKLGLPQARISEIESGRGNPSYQTLRRVAKALDRQLVLARL